ncbi:hypothetical protein M422DRAFT_256690 [Sphaerobolus stellatus SS14]|uniref:Uncharacterized protein n=1 Tax=Sphaerobolus stellatus (strain SS14) TaxID=990650 RepID=A0A0C9UBC2_SPHS4|nr:hypothetical protein M422DRAFT_256690 [Sphaerobolus stellatus SS14]
MDNEPNAHMQVDPSTTTMSAIQAFKTDPSTEWVIESAPGFVAIKHKMGCPICDASASHCMAAKMSYEIHLDEKDISHAVAEAWPELTRYQDNYYHLLGDYNVLKESLYDRLDSRRVTIQNLGNKVQSLEKVLQEVKDNSAELSPNEDLILKNKHLKQELEYYIGRVRYALYGKDPAWAERNGYCITDIPASDGEDDDGDLAGLPTIPEDIPQNIHWFPPPTVLAQQARLSGTTLRLFMKQVSLLLRLSSPTKTKKDRHRSPVSITGVLPRPLGKARAEQWDQPALRGASEWIMEHGIHDSEMRRLYIEVARHNDPDWMTEVIQSFNANPSGVPRNLQFEGLHVNINDANVWYWVNLIKSKYRGAEAEVLLQSIFSTPCPARYTIPHNQKLNKGIFSYWLGCEVGVTLELAQEKLEPYFICRSTRTIWNEITLRSQLQANEIASLKGGIMNHVGEPMDQDETDPEPTLIQPTAGSSSLADRLDYGEGGSFSHPPVDTHELWACISYYDSLVPQGTAHGSTAELTEELTCDLYGDNLE